MATGNFAISNLNWVSSSGGEQNLLAVITCDLNGYDSYTINASGMFRTLGNVAADGLIVDNILGRAPVTVASGELVVTVPAFTKDSLRLEGTSPTVKISGEEGAPRLSFYRGRYLGSQIGVNTYEASQMAYDNTLTNGTVDAYLRTVRFKNNWALPAGYDLNVVTDAGFYDIDTPANGPGAGIWHVTVKRYSSSALWVYQVAAKLNAAGEVHHRWLLNGTWVPWQRIIFQGDSPSFNYLYAAELDIGGRADIANGLGVTGYLGVTGDMGVTGSVSATFFRPSNTGGLIIDDAAGGATNQTVLTNNASNQARFYVGGTAGVTLDTSGNVLLGKTSASAGVAGWLFTVSANSAYATVTKDVSGGRSIFDFFDRGTPVGGISISDTGTSFLTTSDYRVKNVKGPATGAVSRVRSLRVYEGTFKKAPDKPASFFLAHELQNIKPESVTGEKDCEQFQAVDHSSLVPDLTAALQFALDKIDALEAEIIRLKKPA